MVRELEETGAIINKALSPSPEPQVDLTGVWGEIERCGAAVSILGRADEAHTLYRDAIKNRLSKFEEFLVENDLGNIEPLQYEMTYINHIHKG